MGVPRKGDPSFLRFWVFARPVTLGGCGLPSGFTTCCDGSRRCPEDSPRFQMPSVPLCVTEAFLPLHNQAQQPQPTWAPSSSLFPIHPMAWGCPCGQVAIVCSLEEAYLSWEVRLLNWYSPRDFPSPSGLTLGKTAALQHPLLVPASRAGEPPGNQVNGHH